MSKRFVHAIAPAAGVAIFVLVLIVLRREVAEYKLADVVAELRALPRPRLAGALILTILNYFVLTAYDTLSFRFIRHALAYRKVAFASFLSYVFSHNVGLSFLGGTAVRVRFYSGWGVSATEITDVVLFNSVTFWLGFLALTGIGLVVSPGLVLDDLGVSRAVANAAGVLCLSVLAAYFVWTARRRTPLRWRGWELPLPTVRLSVAQLLLSSLDWALAGAVLYTLLPSDTGIGFGEFLSAFLLAQVAGLISHVPAGLGVFDTVIVLFLTPEVPAPAALGALAAYRIIYYLLPLLIAAAMLAVYEFAEHRRRALAIGRAVGARLPAIIVPTLAVLVFLSGAVLLVSGAIGPQHSRFDWLEEALPLSVIEVSHFVGSIAGVLLLLLARGLYQRLDAAWWAAMVLLAAGAAAMLLKGLHVEEAALSLITAAILWPCRDEFYRRSALFDEHLTAGWIAAIGATLVAAAWLLVFSYEHEEYATDLWWTFELYGHASRSVRAMLGAAMVCVVYGSVRMLAPARLRAPQPDEGDLAPVRAIVAGAPDTSAHLALLGDKRFFFNERRTAMVMFGVFGRTWVAMGDPVGADAEIRDLVWSFCAAADRGGASVSFYEIGTRLLPLYLDLGLLLVKLGEQARVDLGAFNLEGGARKSMRQHTKRIERDGSDFAVVPVAGVPPLLDELEAISNGWLAGKNTREKRFSLGSFDRAYLSQTPVAVVRRAGRIVAFSNVWLGAGKEEISPDLMRYGDDAPAGVMDYLFVKLMLWGQAEGYRWFNLGMAPLSGLEAGELAPLWGRVGAFLFRHGEHFYNFQGLRQYKEKFDPEWSPRYLAIPSFTRLPAILTALAALVSGGLTGVVKK